MGMGIISQALNGTGSDDSQPLMQHKKIAVVTILREEVCVGNWNLMIVAYYRAGDDCISVYRFIVRCTIVDAIAPT